MCDLGTGLLAEHPRSRVGQGVQPGAQSPPSPGLWPLPMGALGQISDESPAGGKVSQEVHGF